MSHKPSNKVSSLITNPWNQNTSQWICQLAIKLPKAKNKLPYLHIMYMVVFETKMSIVKIISQANFPTIHFKLQVLLNRLPWKSLGAIM